MADRRRWLVACTKPHHGLGNRVRSVLGARVLARVEDRRFAYVWPVGEPFGARFDELWQIEDPVVGRLASRALALRFPYRDHTLDWLDDAARRARVWQIRTAHALHLPPGATPWISELRGLPTVPAIAGVTADFHRRHLASGPYVGVMMRTHPHSHRETLTESPVEWYVERMQALRRRHPELRFFVSADTSEGFARLRSQVPGCVGLEDKGPYNSRVALQAAVTDLYLLAASCHVLGPHFSSFPELAQRLAGPELRLETSRTLADRAFESGPLTQAADPARPHRREAVLD